MLQTFFKIAYRNLRKNKWFSLINILGLAIGLTCFLIITAFVLNELSYDKFFPDAARMYRINSDLKIGSYELHIAQTSDKMGEVLKKDYPQIEDYTRIYTNEGAKMVRKGDAFVLEEDIAYVDSNFFRFFPRPVIAGNLFTALNAPHQAAISETTAKKYFGNTDVVGNTLEINDKNRYYKVTAVYKDFPENSHIDLSILLPMQDAQYPWGAFLSHNFHSYLKLKPGADPKEVAAKFPQYVEKYAVPEARTIMQVSSMDEFRKAGNRLDYSLIPVTRIHLYSDYAFEMKPSGNIQYIYIFSAIALFILIIACINFMNLATARSAKRAREVGIRKVLGTRRKQLVLQFISESVITVWLAEIFALAIIFFALPFFNTLANTALSASVFTTPALLAFLLLLPFAVGIIAGIYPAFYLSAYKPVEILKGNLLSGRKNSRLRSVLVVFQFTTAIVLIIGTLVVFGQLNYIKNKDLGYNKDQVLVINNAGGLKANINAFKDMMAGSPGVKDVSVSSYLPVTNSSRSDYSYSKDATANATNSLSMQSWGVDYNYIPTLGLQIKEGRNFSRDFGTDSNGVIINESAAQFLSYDDPIGKKIYRIDDTPIVYTILGVIKNFNYESLHKSVAPLALFLEPSRNRMLVKVEPGKTQEVIQQAAKEWKTMAPEMPFSYTFLNDSFDQMYASEQRTGSIALVFSVLAIFIAGLGLIGLSAFIIEQKTREIGVRKVLGASVRDIIGLVTKDFVLLVLIAFFVACPIAWWAMDRWLQNYVYRMHFSWWIFAAAGIFVLTIALITIGVQAVKASLADPVKSLRSE